jgi:hypothetical protein
MQQFIEKYRDEVTGVLSGFDRLVFRASPRRLNYGCFDKNLALSRNSTPPRRSEPWSGAWCTTTTRACGF